MSKVCDWYRDNSCDCLCDGLDVNCKNYNGDLCMQIVKVYVDCLNQDKRGDLVVCSDCGELMLIQLGGTACGECESENLQWYNDNKSEWTIEELEQSGFIIVEK